MAGSDSVFARIGRQSLISPSVRNTSVSPSSDTASSNLGKNLGISFDLTYGGTGLGRLSAGITGLIVLGLVGFYIATRAHQA